MSKLDCNVIKDMLPLYFDNVCSEQTRALVEIHLEGCEECRRCAEAMGKEKWCVELPEKEELDGLKKVRRYCQIRRMGVVLLLVTSIFLCVEFAYRALGKIPTIYICFANLVMTLLPAVVAQRYTKKEKISNASHMITMAAAVIVLLVTALYGSVMSALKSSGTSFAWALYLVGGIQERSGYIMAWYLRVGMCLLAILLCLLLIQSVRMEENVVWRVAVPIIGINLFHELHYLLGVLSSVKIAVYLWQRAVFSIAGSGCVAIILLWGVNRFRVQQKQSLE